MTYLINLVIALVFGIFLQITLQLLVEKEIAIVVSIVSVPFLVHVLDKNAHQ